MPRNVHTVIVLLALVLSACSCNSKLTTTRPQATLANLEVGSVAFLDGQAIPDRYTCDGEDSSPPVHWTGAPMSTKSFALICDDPDAPGGTWVHWVIFDIPASARELGEPGTAGIPAEAVQGMNDFNLAGWGGPCPPPGTPHRYVFSLYALNTELRLRAGATKKDVLAAMEGHIVGEGRLTGVYLRASRPR